MKKISEMKIYVNSTKATTKIDKATKAAEKLKKALEDIKKLEVEIGVKSVEKKWWHFVS